MTERIEIGIIPTNLRHEETIVQIAEALDNLDSAVSHVFECIDKRISENTDRLCTVKERARKLESQLHYLQTNLNLKAVKMYSAAKYPASHTYKEYKMAVPSQSGAPSRSHQIYKSAVPIKDIPDSYSSANCKTEDGQYTAITNLQEKLQFYHVRTKLNSEAQNGKSNEELFPPHLSSISALLLFDSMDSAYGKLSKRSCHESNPKQQIEDAPDSIIQPWLSSEVDATSSYLYTPTLGEVPQINVPLTLPDLPGIVDDEKFILDLNSQSPIAPSSAVTTPTIHVDLPTPTSTKELPRAEDTPDLPVLMESIPNHGNQASVQHSTPSAPPPPPPPQPLSPDTSVEHNPQESTLKPSHPPPPPPPLPPAAPAAATSDAQITTEKASSRAKPVDDRSNLMEAIRNAGGVGRAKLRRTVPGEKNDDRWSSASVGGDLMADLHAKLALRRKGIAGSATGALERMSSLIPPPPKPSENTTSDRNSAASEYDSQPDTDDWEE